MKTNMENYEERFVDYMEGQLDATEMKEMEAFVAQHPELKEDFMLFCSSKLEPDKAIVFTKKESLMKTKTVMIPMFVKVVSMAASIALLIGIGFHFLRSEQGILPIKFPKATSHLNSMAVKTKPQYVPAPIIKENTVTKTVTKAVTTPVVKADEAPMLAKSEAIPALEPIRSKAVEWSHPDFNGDLALLSVREPATYLTAMKPLDEDSDFSLLSSIKEDLHENAQKASVSLFKKTTKAIFSAYYTADCYINETVRDLKEIASR